MELSKKSWHYRLYLLLNGENASLPTNFCPYFWKTILLGSLFTIVFLPLSIPMMVIRKVWIRFDKFDAPPSIYNEGLFSMYAAVAIVFDIIIVMLYSMVAMWFYRLIPDGKGGYWGHWTQIIGGIGWVIAFVLFIAFLTEYIKDKIQERKTKKLFEVYSPKINPPNVFVEAVKAWYNKHCPMIKWK